MHFARNWIPFAVLVALLSGRTAKAQYTITTLAAFNGDDWSKPIGGLLADNTGNLYGVTMFGRGVNSDGVVFKLALNTHELTQVTTLDNATARLPTASLVADSGGNFYGTSEYGGLFNDGVVYKVDVGTHVASALASFNGTNGRAPFSRLYIDGSGNLFGTTYLGGANDMGTVFKIDARTHEISTLVDFNGPNGAGPRAGLVADAAGNLYGTTTSGGDNTVGGTVFKMDPRTGVLTTLVSFNDANGNGPEANLIVDSNGNLYGTTYQGIIAGSIFQLNTNTNEFTTLVAFNGLNGQHPYTDLIADSAGNLYGTVPGGANGHGTVFKWDASTHEMITLFSFDDALGIYPVSGLVADANGNLFGVATDIKDYGSIYELSPVPEPQSLALLAVGGLMLCWGTLRAKGSINDAGRLHHKSFTQQNFF